MNTQVGVDSEADALARARVATEPTLESGTLDDVEDEPGSEPSRPPEVQSEWGHASQGERVGRYSLLEHLGTGGMGTVYAAYDPQLDRKIALKLLRNEAADPKDRKRAQARLLREAQALAQLSHPNVVAIHDAGEFEGRVYLAMEFVQGKTLDEVLDELHEGGGDWKRGLDLCVAAGRGLAAAHAAGLIHRDFKPANVMVGDDGRVRVMDFGLARAEQAREKPVDPRSVDISSLITRHGSLMGTPAYMSPEQLVMNELGPASDQFSFCVVTYEALFGNRPYQGRTLMELASEVLERPPRPPAARNGTPNRVLEALLKGLAKEPGERFASMDELLAKLDRDRGATGRTWMGVGLAGAGLAAGLAFGGRGDAAAPAPSCDAETAVLARSWNAEKAAELREAFEASDRAHAGATAEKVSTALTQWADDWRGKVGAACRGEDPFPETLAAQQSRCFDRARVEYEALVEVFLEADAKTVDKAIAALESLPELTRCTDPKEVESSVLTPPPDQREAVEAQERILARLNATAETGHHQEVVEPARKLVEDADAIGFAPLRVDARWRLGTALERAGERREGETVLRAGYKDAVAHGRDGRAVDYAIRLAYLVGYAEGRPAEGKLWGEQAEALIERRGNDPLRRGKLLNDMGSVYLGAGEYKQAREAWEQSFALRQASLPPDDPRMAGIHYNLGIGCQVNDDLEGAREHWQKALELREQSYGPLHPFVADSVDTVAIAAKNQGDLAGAMKLYERALELRRTTLGPDHPDVAVSLVNYGQALFAAKRNDDARAKLGRALEILEAANPEGHPDLAHPLGALADVAEAETKYDEALALRTRALEQVEARMGADHPWALELRLALATTLLEAGERAKSRATLKAQVTAFGEKFASGSPEAERYTALDLRLGGGG